MKIRAQIAMVLNLDKCIGCHTCSVTCKKVWTNREGMEYAWFNNVETKPGIGYPKDWENQDRWNGGWVRKKNGKLQPKIGGKWRVLAKIFANPDLPLRCHLQTRGGRHRSHRPGQVPRLAHVRFWLPLQEDLLQLVERQIREVHLLLSAHRGGPAHRVRRNLCGPHSLSGRRALRR